MNKQTQGLMTSDCGMLCEGEGTLGFFKRPVVGPPCSLKRILWYVRVCVIESLSRGKPVER
mgnify:FL=1